MRNISITNSKKMIGEAMYNYMRENDMKADGNSIKLTRLLDIHFYKLCRLIFLPNLFSYFILLFMVLD
jgi:hypothetical protein